MAKRIYVGNLPFSADEKMIRGLFEPYGPVESVSLEMGGRSARTAVVVLKDDGAAGKAIAGLKGKRLGRVVLNVSEARPRTE